MEDANQIGIDNTQDPYARSSGRVLRKSPQLNKKKNCNNYLVSTALYSIGGATFEAAHEYDEEYDDDDDYNIEVCLHPSRILSRFDPKDDDRATGEKQAESKSKSMLKYSCATSEWSEMSETSSFDGFNGEVDRSRKSGFGNSEKNRSGKSSYKLIAENNFE